MGHEANPIRSQKQEEGLEKKEGEEAARKAIRETFFGCCASD